MNEGRPKHIDLFSGIGGFSLAAEAAGFETVAFSEIEDYPSAVLRNHWPDVPNYGDIGRIPTFWYRGVDLLTGGFPCQPFSFAGKRRGSKDHRALWPKMFLTVAEVRPRFFLGENVPGIVNMELDRVLSDLESIGYTCQTFIVPACAVDARHRRDRVWILGANTDWQSGAEQKRKYQWTEDHGGSSGNGLDAGQALADAAGRGINGEHRDTTGETEQGNKGQQEPDCGSETLADSDSTRREELDAAGFAAKPARHTGGSDANVPDAEKRGRQQRNQNAGRSGEGTIAPEERRGLADACGWLPEPTVGRVAHGIPHRSHRLKGLGNAIVPQVAEVFLRAIFQQLRP